MPLQTTTPKTIRDDLVEQIKGIVPSHGQHADKRWEEASQQEDVMGGFRDFRIENRPGGFVEDGFVGDGAERWFFMDVHVAYSDLGPDGDDSILDEDEAQLQETFRDRLDPILPGFFGAESNGWNEDPESEEGARVGFFEFVVTYYAAR